MKLSGFHLEPTNRCVLDCSACERTIFIERFGRKNWVNHDLDLDQFYKFLDVDIENLDWYLCGNTGDPIYYPRLHELAQFIKSHHGRLHLTTNGSYRKQDWWAELLSLLDETDTIEFSVDGSPNTSPIYRINSDWISIDLAMQMSCESPAKVVWKMIPFSFNQHEINAVKNMAESRGMQFRLYPSDRFSYEDPLRPTEQSMVLHRGTGAVEPKCATGHQHFIMSTGHYTPCCWFAHHAYYYKSKFHLDSSQYNISTTTFSQILSLIQDYDEQMRLDPRPVCSYTCRQS